MDLIACVEGRESATLIGKLEIIVAIEEPAVILKILTHLGLPARAPPSVSGAISRHLRHPDSVRE